MAVSKKKVPPAPPSGLKRKLIEVCLEFQQQRIEHTRKAMDDAQASANSEERSTAGDKYDTARAMAMGVREMNAKQLHAALNDLQILQHLNPESVFNEIRTGSLVKTSQGNYFIAISGGPFKVGEEEWLAVSAASPLGQSMMGKKKEDTVVFREKIILISEVF